jgi:hypothetical protein
VEQHRYRGQPRPQDCRRSRLGPQCPTWSPLRLEGDARPAGVVTSQPLTTRRSQGRAAPAVAPAVPEALRGAEPSARGVVRGGRHRERAAGAQPASRCRQIREHRTSSAIRLAEPLSRIWEPGLSDPTGRGALAPPRSQVRAGQIYHEAPRSVSGRLLAVGAPDAGPADPGGQKRLAGAAASEQSIATRSGSRSASSERKSGGGERQQVARVGAFDRHGVGLERQAMRARCARRRRAELFKLAQVIDAVVVLAP